MKNHFKLKVDQYHCQSIENEIKTMEFSVLYKLVIIFHWCSSSNNP